MKGIYTDKNHYNKTTTKISGLSINKILIKFEFCKRVCL